MRSLAGVSIPQDWVHTGGGGQDTDRHRGTAVQTELQGKVPTAFSWDLPELGLLV